MVVRARGLSFEVTTGGPERGPIVLLLHGFPQNSTMWDLVTPALHAAGRRTVAVDQRGYSPGARPAAVNAYRLDECVADALAIVDVIGRDLAGATATATGADATATGAHATATGADATATGAVDVVGHDWGAVVAWALAARHPERVRTLTAVSVPHPAALSAAIAGDAGQRARSAYIGLFRKAGKAEQVLLGNNATALRTMFDGCPPDRVDRYVRPMGEPGALTAALNWYRAQQISDLSTVGPVTVPSTYVWSEGDIAVGELAALSCADHVTGPYRFVRLPGVSHWLPDEAPGPLADAVLRQLADAPV